MLDKIGRKYAVDELAVDNSILIEKSFSTICGGG